MNGDLEPVRNTRGKQTAPRLRCAIYTRKSTEDGLEQDFNSLDAQREACAAYVSSQESLGWRLSPQHYNDGGISGGTLNRPALMQLLDDVKQGLIDIIVVYKIDRLTRSLMDFAKMVDVFDEHGISFVSITQQFNTTASMGRLTLNVLLSFAQFEREVTAERIKDKIAASKKKGMWMGGVVPLGYAAKDKKLIINPEEAKTVKWLFDLYLELGSVSKLVKEASTAGLNGRTYNQKNGVVRASKPFARGNLYHLLSNPIYIGKTKHQEQLYEGQHEAIVEEHTWQVVQNLLQSNSKVRCSDTNTNSTHLLKGLAFDETGDRLTPTYATKNGVRYHYYISSRLSNGRPKTRGGWRIAARQLEEPILQAIAKLLTNIISISEIVDLKEQAVHLQEQTFKKAAQIADVFQSSKRHQVRTILSRIINRVTLEQHQIKIELSIQGLSKLLGNYQTDSSNGKPNLEVDDCAKGFSDQKSSDTHCIELPHSIAKRGVEAKLVLHDLNSRTPHPDQTLIETIATAHLWQSKLTDGTASSIGELAKQIDHDPNEISRFLPLTFLAPDIVEGILAGTQPVDLTQEKLRRLPALPYSWADQREMLGFSQ